VHYTGNNLDECEFDSRFNGVAGHMKNKLKKYMFLLLLIIGLVFLGIGCTGTKNNEGPSSTEKTPAGESESIFFERVGYSSPPCTG
jgi:phosphate transport system substrate-binding protein